MAKRVKDRSSSAMALTAMKLLLGVVFLGWLLIWVMMPTNTYRKHWSPMLRSKTNSTYFGRQGTNMLIYGCPILFIAVLGCIYLHIVQKSSGDNSDDSGRLTRHLKEWKRPVLVKGPLGIVSGIELAFCLMFVTLLVWFCSCYLSTSFANIHRTRSENNDKLWVTVLATVALRLGLVGNLCLAFLFFPVTRASSLLPLVGLTSESSIKYHVWLGHITMALFTAHGVCYVISWATTNQISKMVRWGKVGISNVSGEIALLCGLFMWATTFSRVRRKMFELFFYTHYLYILFIVFYLFHVGIPFFCYILPGVYLFMVDRFLRFLQSRSNVRLISARILPSETVELNFSKDPSFNYNPLSIVFVNIPSISSLQWHPFTVSSNSSLEPERLSVIIKKEGSWTEKLHRTVSSSSLDHLNVKVEGPYGPNSMDLLRYDSLVMVSGGSGITPFISIIRELIYRSTTIDSPTPNVLLICSFKTSADLTMLDLLLPVSSNISDLSGLRLRIEAFVTREKAPLSEPNKLIHTRWFKPSSSDLPVAPVLGANNWLWLGTVISSSFVAFLILTGIVTRYYIYPIDHNTNSVYPWASRAALNLFFICICIAATSTAAVLWNKKRSTTEAKKIKNMEASTPTSSPGALSYNADRELESIPRESIVGATTVQFGERPNLKKMLLECKGSNVGVMASGPGALLQAVASICSSGPAKNMHFESISFSW